MILGDIFVSCIPNCIEVIKLLADYFAVAKNRVCIFEDEFEMVNCDGCDVKAVIRELEGDFPCQLIVYHQDNAYPEGSEIAFATWFSVHLKVKCLVPGENLNPYDFRLINENGECSNVFVDEDKMDNEQQYCVRE